MFSPSHLAYLVVSATALLVLHPVSDRLAHKWASVEWILKYITSEDALHPLRIYKPRGYAWRARIHNDINIDVMVLNYPETHGYRLYEGDVSSIDDLRRPGTEGRQAVEANRLLGMAELWSFPEAKDPDRGRKWQLMMNGQTARRLFLIDEKTQQLHPFHDVGTLRRLENRLTLAEITVERWPINIDVYGYLAQRGDELSHLFLDLRKLQSLHPEDEVVQSTLLTTARRLQETRWHMALEMLLEQRFLVKLLTIVWKKVKSLRSRGLMHCMLTNEAVYVRNWHATAPFNITVLPEFVAGAGKQTLIVVRDPAMIWPGQLGHFTEYVQPVSAHLLSREPDRYLAGFTQPIFFFPRELTEDDVVIEGHSTLEEGDDPMQCVHPRKFIPDEVAMVRLITQTFLEYVNAALDYEDPSILTLADKGFDWCQLLRRYLKNVQALVNGFEDNEPSGLKDLYTLMLYASTKGSRSEPVEGLARDKGTLLDIGLWQAAWKPSHSFMYSAAVVDDDAYAKEFDLEVAKGLLGKYDRDAGFREVDRMLSKLQQAVDALERVTETELRKFQLRADSSPADDDEDSIQQKSGMSVRKHDDTR